MRALSAAIAALLIAAVPAWADMFDEGGLPYRDVVIKDCIDGKMVVEVGGKERTYDLSGITRVELTGHAGFNAAEAARKDAAKAADLYRRALPAIPNRGKKRLAQARALPVFDAAGRYADAIEAFLDLYAARANATTWDLRPKNMPSEANSDYLKQAARALSTRLTAPPFTSGEPQKNLRTLLLEIYSKQGDTENAGKIARLLGTEVPSVPETPTNVTGPTNTSRTPEVTPSKVNLPDVEQALAKHDYTRVISLADAALADAREDVAIKLFAFKARAYQGQKKPALAAGEYLRIATHYPQSHAASESLLQAAQLQLQANNKAEAKALVDELQRKYKDTAAAVKARQLPL